MPQNKSEIPNDHRWPVSRSALIKRINRCLARTFDQLRTYRIPKEAPWCRGRYYIVDFLSGYPTGHGNDLEGLGRELGVLKRHERLVEEEAAV